MFSAVVLPLCAMLTFVPQIALAHAFGEGVSLELPFSYLALGVTVALIYSFGTFLLLSRDGAGETQSVVIARLPHLVTGVLRALGVLMLIVAIYAGVEDVREVVPFFWIGVMLMGPYTGALIDGLWARIHPFETIMNVLFRTVRGLVPYPSSLGAWPALGVYVLVILLELVSGGRGAEPHIISLMLIAYLVVSIVGSALFGVREWFRHGDFFNTLFRMFGMLAPIRIDEQAIVRVASPVARLSHETPESWSVLFFILFMTASTSFDGLSDTQWWQASVSILPGAFSHPDLLKGVLLFVCTALMIGAYVLGIVLMRSLTYTREPIRSLALRFGYTLIPIAVAYNIAHYCVLVVQGFGPFRPEAMWTTQIAVIAGGHIIATYLAHKVAARHFARRSDILVGQIPMLMLMVIFTVLALRILSLPIAS